MKNSGIPEHIAESSEEMCAERGVGRRGGWGGEGGGEERGVGRRGGADITVNIKNNVRLVPTHSSYLTFLFIPPESGGKKSKLMG